MPRYITKDGAFNIPDDVIEDFERDNPDAKIEYEDNGDVYEIPIPKRDAFLKQYPNATLTKAKQKPLIDSVPAVPMAENVSLAPSPSKKPKESPFGINANIPTIAETARGMVNGVNVNPFASLPNQPIKPITEFGEGVKEGGKQLVAGAEYAAGETLRPIVGTSEDDKAALERIESLEDEGKDVAKNVQSTATISPAMALGLKVFGPKGSSAFVRTMEKTAEANIAAQKALKEADGNVEQAKSILEEKANKKTLADTLRKDAERKMAEARPTKGWGWVGSMIPQMVGTGVGLGMTAVTKNPMWAQTIGLGNMAGLTASAAGSAMAEARQAGASNAEVWTAGLLSGVIENVSERFALGKYTKGLVNAAKKSGSQAVKEAVAEVGSPARKELAKLLDKANKQLDGKLLSGKNVEDYIVQVWDETLSEGAAEALQTVAPMLYQNPDDYPNLWGIVKDVANNTLEGMKGGLFMGFALGGLSKSAEHRINRARRKAQGFVDVAEVINPNGTRTIVEVVKDDNGEDAYVEDGKYVPLKSQEIGRREQFKFDDFERGQFQNEQDESYDIGKTLETTQEMKDANTMLQKTEAEVRRLLGDDAGDANVDEMLGNNPLEFARQKYEEEEEVGQAILDYLNAKATEDGIIDKAKGQIKTEVEQAEAMIDSRKSLSDGMIHRAVMKTNDRQVYVISGNVVRFDDGNINTQESDDSIIVMDAETGEKEFVSPKDLLSIDVAIDPEVEKKAVRTTIGERIATDVENKLNGVLAFNPNDTYEVLNPQGERTTVQVVSDNGDGTINVIMGDAAEPIKVTKNAVQTMADNLNSQRADEMLQGRNEMLQSEKLQKEAEQMAVPTATETPAEVAPAPRVVPTTKDGKPDFNAMDAEMFVEEYASRYGEENTAKIARKNIAVEREKIAKIDKKIDDVTDPNQIDALYEQRQASEAVVNRYNEILERLGLSEDANETEAEQKSRLRNEANNRIASLFPDGMPNVESFILADIATGNRLRWSDKDTNGVVTSRGLGAELGLSDTERRRRLPLIGKDAMTPEEYAESLRERLDAVGIRYDESSLRDAVLDVYSSVDSRKGAWDALENISKKMQEPQADMDWEDMQQQLAYNKAQENVDNTPELPSLDTIEEETPISEGEYAEMEQQAQAEEQKDYDAMMEENPPVRSVDNQGNLIDANGVLVTEKVESIDDITDEDFENPYRSIELPTLPQNVDNAIGANGKPIVIKKNIFERNIIRHSDLNPEQSRDILKSALYTPNLYGQNQKRQKPYNWVVVSTKDANGQNKLVLLEISDKKDNVEIVHWHFVDARGLEKLKRQAEREDGQLLILPSESTEEVGALSDPTLNISSESKDNAIQNEKQEISQENAEPSGEKTTPTILSEEEYVDAELIKLKPDELSMEDWEYSDEYVDAYNKAVDAYPNYIKSLADSGALQEAFDKGTLGEQIAIRKNIQTAGFEVADILDTGNSKKSKGKKTRGRELMENLGLTEKENTDDEQIRFRENMRREPLRERAKMWEDKVGVKVNLIESYEDIPTEAVKRAVAEGQRFTGWVADGQVYLYMPYITNRTELDKTYLHEVVAHVGMENLLTKEGYKSFCERVFNEVMSDAQREYYLGYPGVKNEAMAADEFIAHLAEDTDMNASVWQKIVRIFRDALRKMGVDIHLTNADIEAMLRDSYKKLVEENRVDNGAITPAESENGILFRAVTDPKQLKKLEEGETMKVYRAMQVIDGKLYPPMSAKVNGKLREPIELGVWEEAEENPSLADDKGYFKLDKGNKKSLKARYNPYIHTSTTPLNDQFSEAQDRPNLVTVEVEIPVSELTSGYKAEKAKDAVGKLEWKAGVVQGKLSGTRTVILSRWDKPIRIVPDSEVADVIVDMFDGRDITMPSNVVTPSLRTELEKRGIPFVETDNQGKEVTRFRSVYHGSGAEFDKFDHSFIGTGEGNQAFGWGTYVTEDENKARAYAQIHPLFYNKRLELSKLRREQSKLSENIPFLKGKALKKATQELEKIKKALTSLSNEANRYLYSVEIPDNNGNNYLEHGKVLSKVQQNKIKEKLYNRLIEIDDYTRAEKELKRELDQLFDSNEFDGKDVYGTVSSYLGSDKDASAFLNELGYVGISYPANGSKANGARNYVIFNEADLDITDNIRFRSGENAPTFYSNADNAVESVMQGQPLFRTAKTNYESQFAELQSEYDALDKNDAEALNTWRDKKADVVRSYINRLSNKFGLKCELYVFNGGREEEMRKAYDTMVEKYKAEGIEKVPSYESFKKKVSNPKVVATHRKSINFVTFNTSADDAELNIEQFAETLFHENAHRIAEKMYSKQEFEQIWENAKKSKNSIAKSVEELYSDKSDAQKGNEFIAKAIGELVSNHNRLFTNYLMGKDNISAGDLVKKLKYSLPLGKLALTETLNEFKNEYQERVLQGSGSSILGGGRDGGDIEVSRRDGGRNRKRDWQGDQKGQRAERRLDVVGAATDLAESLGVKLNVIEDVNEITDTNTRRQRDKRGAKAWYDVNTDQVYFVAPNATSIEDAQMSVLHEVVAHKGLRDVVGRENFNKFLDKVFYYAEKEIRSRIVRLASQNGWNFRVATEEYLASLAEEGFDSRENRTFLQKVRDFFMDMLREAKIAIGFNISDNDMRYMLWRTYQMQKSQGVMAVAEDVLMQQKMGVGNFRTRPAGKSMTEEEQIIADAKANGTYLKAPNGKDTNLTPKQWAQVRTKAFKKWFGDWEKAARIEKLRKSKDAEITGNEIEASEDLKQYRKNALEYGKTLRGEYVNKDTSEAIVINKDSITEVLHHDGSNIAHIQSVAAIPQMVESGIYITSEPISETASKKMRNAKMAHYYVCGLKIDNIPYTVKFVVAEFESGEKYYDHSLTEIEKGDLLNRAELSSTVADSKSPISDIKDKRLVSILQTNSSKVVDANGEPKVVYHRTPNDFTEFDKEKIGSSTDAGALGRGFYFSPLDQYGLYGKNNMALFLNAKKPLMLDDANAFNVKEPFFFDGYSWNKQSSDEFTKWVKDNGYDAVVYKTDFQEEDVVFEPNQIKSATDNVGTFDSNNDDVRFRATPEPTTDKARKLYDEAVRKHIKDRNNVGRFENLWHHFRESYQDSMLAVKALYDAVLKETGNKLHDFEDLYKAENRLSSTNKAQIEAWERDYMKPLQKAILSLIKKGTDYNAIIDYLLAKSGLERNEVLAKRDAEQMAEGWEKKRLDGAKRAYNFEQRKVNGSYGGQVATLNKNLGTGAITQEYYDAQIAKLAKQRDNDLATLERKYNRLVLKIQNDMPEMYEKAWSKLRDKDYSGLTELTGEKDAFSNAAQKMVDAFESTHDTTELWKTINAATKATLRKSYDSGMMNKETFEKTAKMFKYYIPLRGWDNNAAADHYEYMANSNMKILPALKTAKGRTSRADDPIATIGSMGESSIIQGNRNLMKLKLLNFAERNHTSLLTVSEQWYVQKADGTWVEDNPVIPENATGDEVDAIVKKHEADMLALGDKASKERNKLNLGLHATTWEGQEHVVRVKRNGKEYQIFVNGNPIAAQAINGFTNPNAKEGWMKRAAQTIKNFMARAFTSLNPAFIIRNLSIDLLWAGTTIAIKEDAKYVAQYTKNIVSFAWQLPRLLSKWQKGTLDINKPIERYFKEFIENGGETGFTQLNTVDDYKRNMARFIKEAQSGAARMPKKAWRAVWDGVEFLNRSAEDTTRFMTYMTSRQMGRNITDSISDAKDVTVNFNKKGRGEYGATFMNFAYIFFNATIQSLTNFGRLLKHHPKKTTAALTTFASAGLLAPMLSMFVQAMLSDDDDEPTYWDLPEWVRRNNIVLYAPFTKSGYLTVPLPHELRPFYGMGELAFSVLNGKESVEGALAKAVEGFGGLLPFDFTGNGGNMMVNFTPTIAQPIAQLIINQDYFGTPIYRKTAFNELDPEWTKAYKSTNTYLVDATEFLNELTGGDAVEKGWLDINPAKVEHLFESYLGGMGKTLNRTAKTLSMLWDEDMREWRNVPILSDFYQVADERTSGSQINRAYFDAVDEAEDIEHLISGYKKQARMGALEYAEKLTNLINSDIFKRYTTVKSKQQAISNLNKALRESNDPMNEEQIETQIMNLKVDMLEELEKLEKSESSNK